MIELVGVYKAFHSGKPNEYVAVKGIDLRIETGRMTVFVGPSGSGKTTLLSMIGCMSRPTSGRIWLEDREITSLPERFLSRVRRETFGFVFQNINLMKGLTVLENTMIPAYPTGATHRVVKRKAMDLLERLGIGSKAYLKAEVLSGGEQQRAAVARAMINAPSILVADEPTSHLDTVTGESLMEIFSDLMGNGKTIFIASHDPLVFNNSSVDRTVRLRDGKVVGDSGRS